jgi:hypothetical protein
MSAIGCDNGGNRQAARLEKLARALERIETLVRAEIRSNVGPPVPQLAYDIQDVLDSLEVKTS